MHLEILNQPELQALIKFNSDPWANTPFAGYVYAGNKVKGKFGELFTEKFMQAHGFTVASPTDRGHDRIINGIKTEIKFSLSAKNKKNEINDHHYMFNHLSVSKEWERCILVAVNGDCVPVVRWFTKVDFICSLETGKYFRRQQSGTSGNNDDWLYPVKPKNWTTFLNEPWIKDISVW